MSGIRPIWWEFEQGNGSSNPELALHAPDGAPAFERAIAEDATMSQPVYPLSLPLMTATLNDVAKLAKVSPITVSRVLNHPHMVSEKTARRVRNAIAKTGYVPNLLAGGLVSQRSRLVIVVIPTIGHRAFVDTVSVLAQRLAEHRYQLLLCQAGYSGQAEADLIDGILARRPDGLVLTTPLRSAAARERLVARGVPVVETWQLTQDPVDCLVGFSHQAAGTAMARFLIERGHRHIALIWASDIRAQWRFDACTSALADAGVEPVAVERVDVPVQVGFGRQAMARILDSGAALDGVLCSIDLLAQGALAELQARGRRVPEDIAVMGFGDLEFAADLHPRLTSVRIDGAGIGSLAAELILRRIEGLAGRGAERIDVGFEIVERESTRAQ